MKTSLDFIKIVQNKTSSQKSLYATKPFAKAAIITAFSAGIVSKIPTYLTIQIRIDKHITLNPTKLQFCNHSCTPNVFFDTTMFQLLALKDINAGDELTFFYPSSEWNMTQSFACNCGNKNCLANIKGAAHISKEVLANYRLTNFIQEMLATQ